MSPLHSLLGLVSTLGNSSENVTKKIVASPIGSTALAALLVVAALLVGTKQVTLDAAQTEAALVLVLGVLSTGVVVLKRWLLSAPPTTTDEPDKEGK